MLLTQKTPTQAMEQSTSISGTEDTEGDNWISWSNGGEGAKEENENCISQAPQESSHTNTTAFCVCLSTASPKHASLCSTYVSILKITCEKMFILFPTVACILAPVLNYDGGPVKIN